MQHSPIDRAAGLPAIPSRCLLPKAALAVAIAATCLSGASALAADLCTTPTTTISSNTTGNAGDACNLNAPSESLVVSTGIQFSTQSSDLVRITSGTTTGFIDNSGTLKSALTNSSIYISNGTLGGGINNRSGATIDGAEGIWSNCNSIVQSGIVNAGTIKSTGTGGFNHGIVFTCSSGQIVGGITNTGQIFSTRAGFYGIGNVGGSAIDFLANLQGGISPLTYTGKLPAAYRIIVNSGASFGVLAATNPDSAMTFTIAAGSTLQVGTYPAVLTGISAANLTGTLNGTYNGFAWQLVQTAPTSNIWNLVVVSSGPPLAIPAMPALGGTLLAGLLGLLGVWGIRRRRTAG